MEYQYHMAEGCMVDGKVFGELHSLPVVYSRNSYGSVIYFCIVSVFVFRLSLANVAKRYA